MCTMIERYNTDFTKPNLKWQLDGHTPIKQMLRGYQLLQHDIIIKQEVA